MTIHPHVKTVLKVALAGGIIFWLVRTGALDPSALAKLATPGLVVFCLTATFMQIFVNNYRWLQLLKGQGFDSSVRRTLPLSLIGMFFNFVMPGGVGGDVVKGYYLLQEHPKQRLAAAVSILMDRFMGFFVMIFTAGLAIFFSWSHVEHSSELKSVAVGVLLLNCGFAAFYFFAFSNILQFGIARDFLLRIPLGKRVLSVLDMVHGYRREPRALFAAAGLSFVNQIILVAFVYSIGDAMNLVIPISAYFFLVPVGVTVQALPISPAGIGVGQVAFYFLFNNYLGEKSQLGPNAVTAMQVANLFWGLFGGYFFLRRKKPVHLSAEGAEQAASVTSN